MHTKSVKWGARHWFFFVLSYAFGKLALLWEVRRPKWRFLLYELRHSFAGLINTFIPYFIPTTLFAGSELLETRHERFLLRPRSRDASVVSPAFEREDRRYLRRILDLEFAHGGRVGFLDIGAHIGAFSVRVAKYGRKHGLKTWAFEPIPENFARLQANLQLNGLDETVVTPFNFALGERSETASMSFSSQFSSDAQLVSTAPTGPYQTVQVRRADELLKDLPPVLILKIDVEGHEYPVLKGMAGILNTCKTCWLCIEDGTHGEVLHAHLRQFGFQFDRKISPYNSWWRIQR